jgi:hypothetical protein
MTENEKKPSRLKLLMAEYGQAALWTYLGIFAIVLCSFALAIKLGFKSEGTGTGAAAGTWLAAWIATKVTQPLRIMATVGLTPITARLVRRKQE